MKKTYKVVGDLIVHGHAKGETFSMELPEHAEALLIESGHVQVVPGAEPKIAPAEPKSVVPVRMSTIVHPTPALAPTSSTLAKHGSKP